MNTYRLLRLAALTTAMLAVTFFALSHTASTTEDEGDVDARVVASQNSQTGYAEKGKKGNALARAFKFPFRKIGRLFGGGGGRDGDQMARSAEKDAGRFESVGVLRVTDSRTPERASERRAGLSAREYYERGKQFLESGRLNDAIAELSTAASLDPRFREAHNLLGVAYDRKGLGDRAKESYERALKHGDEDAQALNNLGYSLYLHGNYRAAVDRLKRAAKLAPGDERILNNLALALSRLGRWDDARKAFVRASGETTGRLNLAAMLVRAGRAEEAIEEYETVRQLDPSSEYVRDRLTELYRRHGRRAELETLAARD